MEYLPYLPVLVVAAGAIYGFARLEAKTNHNTTDLDDVFKHMSDNSIHHPADELNRRFDTMELSIGKIETGINRVNDRLDRILEK